MSKNESENGKPQKKKHGCMGCLGIIIFLVILAGIFGEDETKEETVKDSTEKVESQVAPSSFHSFKEVSGNKEIKTKIKKSFDQYASKWGCSDAQYKLIKDNENKCLKLIIMFKGDNVPNNTTKFLERISENVGLYENMFIVQCIVETNPSKPVHELHWKNTRKHAVIAVENTMAEFKEQDKSRLESARRENISLRFQQNLSGWDGSFPQLVFAVKETMHDPGSFKHVKTTFSVQSYDGDGIIYVSMTYRGKNAYGATVTDTIGIHCTPDGKLIDTQSENSSNEKTRLLERIKRDIQILDFYHSVEFSIINLIPSKDNKFDLFIMMEYENGINRKYPRDVIELCTNSEFSKNINEIKINYTDMAGPSILIYDYATKRIIEKKK